MLPPASSSRRRPRVGVFQPLASASPQASSMATAISAATGSPPADGLASSIPQSFSQAASMAVSIPQASPASLPHASSPSTLFVGAAHMEAPTASLSNPGGGRLGSNRSRTSGVSPRPPLPHGVPPRSPLPTGVPPWPHPRPGVPSRPPPPPGMSLQSDPLSCSFLATEDTNEEPLDPLNHESAIDCSDWSVGDEAFLQRCNFRSTYGGGYLSETFDEGATNSEWSSMASQPDDEEQPFVDANGPLRPNQGRSRNFSDDEDYLLVSAWLNISLDAVQGVDQSKATYWGRIYNYFHTHKTFNSNRSENSLMHRWSAIQEAVNKFCGCMSQIENRNQSGTTIEDRISQARKLYKVKDPKNRAFTLMNCYDLLKNQPKWHDKRVQLASEKNGNKKQKHTDKASPTLSTPPCTDSNNADQEEDGNPSAGGGGFIRPLGRKKEKEKLRQQSERSQRDALDYLWAKKKEADAEKETKKDERYKQAFELDKSRIALEKEKFEFERMIQEERILRTDTTDMTPPMQDFYKSLKDKILIRHMNS